MTHEEQKTFGHEDGGIGNPPLHVSGAICRCTLGTKAQGNGGFTLVELIIGIGALLLLICLIKVLFM